VGEQPIRRRVGSQPLTPEAEQSDFRIRLGSRYRAGVPRRKRRPTAPTSTPIGPITTLEADTIYQQCLDEPLVASAEDFERRLEWMLAEHGDAVEKIPRGLSPEGRTIYEIVIKDPAPGPKHVMVWHLDPHPWDERIATPAALGWVTALLKSRPHLAKREIHLFLTSPDVLAKDSTIQIPVHPDQTRARTLPSKKRYNDASQLTSWSVDHPRKKSAGNSSAGWVALRQGIKDLTTGIAKRHDGSVLRFMISGHNAVRGTGPYFLIDAKPALRKGVGGILERRWGSNFGLGFGRSTDTPYLHRVQGTSATYPAVTAKRLRRAEPNAKVRSSDVELTAYYAWRHLRQQIVTTVIESPEEVLTEIEQSNSSRQAGVTDLRTILDEARTPVAEAVALAKRAARAHGFPIGKFTHNDSNSLFGGRKGNFDEPKKKSKERPIVYEGVRVAWRLRDVDTLIDDMADLYDHVEPLDEELSDELQEHLTTLVELSHELDETLRRNFTVKTIPHHQHVAFQAISAEDLFAGVLGQSVSLLSPKLLERQYPSHRDVTALPTPFSSGNSISH
jgi:hypothetical protein